MKPTDNQKTKKVSLTDEELMQATGGELGYDISSVASMKNNKCNTYKTKEDCHSRTSCAWNSKDVCVTE